MIPSDHTLGSSRGVGHKKLSLLDRTTPVVEHNHSMPNCCATAPPQPQLLIVSHRHTSFLTATNRVSQREAGRQQDGIHCRLIIRLQVLRKRLLPLQPAACRWGRAVGRQPRQLSPHAGQGLCNGHGLGPCRRRRQQWRRRRRRRRRGAAPARVAQGCRIHVAVTANSLNRLQGAAAGAAQV